MNKPVRLAGSTVAITGAARGIGKATAAALAREGAKVAIGDLDLELAEATAEELPGTVVASKLDVTDEDSFREFLDRAEADLGPLAVMINNAGLMGTGAFVEETMAAAQLQIEVNLTGVVRGSKLAVPRMLKHGRGHLVNLASAAGKANFGGAATYCATKHAVVALSESILLEYLKSPLNVSVVMPSVVETELTSGFPEKSKKSAISPDEVGAAILGALQKPRFEVYAPKSIGAALGIGGALPGPARRKLGALVGADSFLFDIDEEKRAAYAARTGS